MKRILSIVLAVALVASLIPAVFAAEENYIRYSISVASLSTETFVGEHPIPMEDGKLLNTSKAYDKETDTITIAKAVPTMQNVIKYLQGSTKDGTSATSWANSELSMISYRPIEYYNYRTKAPATIKDSVTTKAPTDNWMPIRKFSNSVLGAFDETAETSSGYEAVNGAAKIYTMPSVLAATTAPFEMFGKNNDGMSHSFLADGHYYATFNLGSKTASTFEANRGTLKESFFPIRIKVPETAEAGTYKIRVGNTYKTDTTANTYGDLNASECEVYLMKIGANGFEGKFHQTSGNLMSFVDASGKAIAYDTIVNSDNKLTGTYKSIGKHSDTFEDVLALRPGEEYFLYFRIAEGAMSDADVYEAAKNTNNTGKVYFNGSTAYQNFKISYIDIIPYESDKPVVLESAEIVYNESTKKVSVISAIMSDGKDATGYTVKYGMTGADEAKINATTGAVTPGTEDETVTLWADVTLGDVTIRATLSDILINGYVEGRLKYLISANALNADAKAEISALDGDAALIRNSEMLLVSWKEISYLNTDKIPVKVAPGTAGASKISNVLNLSVTDKYELPGRSVEDNSPRLLPGGLNSQFVGRRWKNTTEINSQAYLAENYTSRPKYTIKVYVPQKGAYKLTLANNFTLAEIGKLHGTNFFESNGSEYTASLGNEVWTEVYFSKAEYDLPYNSASPIFTRDQLVEICSEENRVGWYDSGSYGKVTKYDKVLVAPEAGEYYVTFTTSPESYEKNNKFWHRDLGNGVFVDYQLFSLSEIRLDPVASDAEYEKAFDAVEKDYITSATATVNAYTYAESQEELSLGNSVSLGGSFSATAPDKEGYEFLYWAKGLGDKKQIISYSKNLSFRPSEGANYVIAVYVKEGATETRAEFYNANGSLIAVVGADGNAPAYPSMAGFGRAGGWQLYGTDEVYGADEEIADMAGSGNMILVAKYGEEPETVIVNGEEYKYGETVRMPAVDSSKIFKGWKRNGELVSADKSYTFKAWENATVEAIYAESTPAFAGKFMKIVIDAFNAGDDKAVMAEFIGLEGAIEKGVKIGNKKISMKSGDKQFSILADIEGEYIGYAILRDGDGFIEITDGSIEIE